MHRFFIPCPDISGGAIIISEPEQLHHIKRVLCLKPKEPVSVFDREGNEYSCVISGIGEKVALEVKEKRPPDRSGSRLDLTIACAIPKKARFDDIVDKLTQLGVSKIIPLITERVIVKFDGKKEGGRLIRWRKIAQSGAEQSQRKDIPVVEPVCKLKDLLARSTAFDLKLIPCLSGARQGLRDILASSRLLPGAAILVIIGPEGDFSGEEVESAKNAGFIPVSLGNLTLRVDTAAIAIASFFSLYAHH